MRPAFTIVELLVALVVLGIGVLALAATAGLVAAHVGDGGRLTGAAHAARTTIDSLTTRRCADLVSGSAVRGGTALEWSITRDSLAVRIDLIVGATLRRGREARTHQAIVPCAAS